MDELIQNYWKSAPDYGYLMLSTRILYESKNVTVLELTVTEYMGEAHGATDIQLVNWSNTEKRPLAFEELIASGQTEAFNQVLAQAHQQWLTREPAAKDGLEQYLQSWPFVPTTNIGLVEDGVIAQY